MAPTPGQGKDQDLYFAPRRVRWSWSAPWGTQGAPSQGPDQLLPPGPEKPGAESRSTGQEQAPVLPTMPGDLQFG